MGVDLIPDTTIDPYHANIAGWSTLTILLTDLGRAWAQSNEAHVTETSARLMAEAIEQAINTEALIAVDIPDDCYSSGSRTRFRLANSEARDPLPLNSTDELIWATLRTVVAPELHTDSQSEDRPTPAIRHLDHAERMWLRTFANFCRASQGFEIC